MAKSNRASTTDEDQEGSLLDFEFDEPQDFFGIKKDTLGSEKVIQQVKKVRTGDDFDDDTDDGTPTSLEDEKDKNKGKTKGKKKDEEIDDDPEITDDDFNFGDKLRSSKEKETAKEERTTKKVVKKEEEIDGENIEDEEIDDNKDKGKVKGKKDEEDDDPETEIDEEKVFGTLAKELEEKGIFSKVEVDKDGRLTEDKFFEHFETELEARVDETFETFFKEMDDEGKAFLKYKRDGGDTRTFITQYGSSLGLEEFDEDKPEHVNKVLSHYLRVYEHLQDDEEFEDRLKYIKDSGKDKATAKRQYAIIAKDDKDRKEAIIKIQEKASQDRKDNAKAFDDAVRDTLDKTEKIGVYTFTKAEKKELDTYITKATIKVGGGKYIPELLAEIRRILGGNKKEDREDLILLAKNMKNKFKVPDNVVKDVNTAIVRKTRSKIAEARNTTRLASSGQHSKKAMADYFPEE